MLKTEIDEQSKHEIHLTRLKKRTDSMYHIKKKFTLQKHYIPYYKRNKNKKTKINKIVHGSGYNVLYVMKRYWIIHILRANIKGYHLKFNFISLNFISMFIPSKIHYHTASK